MRGRSCLVAVLALGLGVPAGGAVGVARDVVSGSGGSAAAGAGDVVVESLTTPTRLVTRDLGTGRMTAQLSALPVRLKDADGVWRPVDATLERRGDRVVPRRVPTGMSFSAGGSGELASIEDQARGMGLSWPEVLPEPVLSGSTATYPEVWPGVDLTVQAGVTGFSTYLVVKTPAAAKDPRVRDFAFGTRTAGVDLRAGQAGGFQGVDAGGKTVFESAQPRMWDSSGAPAVQSLAAAGEHGPVWKEHGGSRSRAMPATVSAGKVSVHADTSLLDDPGARFPIVLDPGISRTRAYSYWVMVWSDGQYFINDATQNTRVGYDGWSGNKISRAFFNFDTSGLYGKTILKAALKHNQVHSPQGTCDVAHYGSAIQAGVTWGIGSGTRWPGPGFITMGGTNDYGHGASSSCPGGDVVEWDMTAPIAKHASSASAPVLTLGLKGVNEADKYGWRQYDNAPGSMPQLYVEYNSTPTTPTNLLVQGSTSGWATTTTPSLTATFGDADRPAGQQLKGRFQVVDSAGTVVYTVDTAYLPASSSTTAAATVTVPAGKLVDGKTYTVRAYSVDSVGATSPVATRSFTVDTTAPAAHIVSVTGPSSAAVATKGQPVTITASSASTDVSQLCATFRTTTLPCVNATPNVAATIAVPATAVNEIGPAMVKVWAKDKSGHTGPAVDGQIRVQSLAAGMRWRLDDAAWSTIYDPAGMAVAGNALTPVGTVTRVPGRSSLLDETDQAVHASTLKYGPTPVIDTTGGFTVMAWVRPDDAAMLDGAASQVAVSQDVDVAGARSVFELGSIGGAPSFRLRTGTGGSTVVTASSGAGWATDVHGWTKLTGIYDATANQVRLYVNNDLVAEEAATEDPESAKGSIWIGRASSAGAAASGWAGDVDTTAVFSSALSATQVANELEN